MCTQSITKGIRNSIDCNSYYTTRKRVEGFRECCSATGEIRIISKLKRQKQFLSIFNGESRRIPRIRTRCHSRRTQLTRTEKCRATTWQDP
uniref:Uncharacterized protein n=1 Tax=Megaselia scalaris TaxID=36166 RepID=T1GV39_MEGSC